MSKEERAEARAAKQEREAEKTRQSTINETAIDLIKSLDKIIEYFSEGQTRAGLVTQLNVSTGEMFIRLNGLSQRRKTKAYNKIHWKPNRETISDVEDMNRDLQLFWKDYSVTEMTAKLSTATQNEGDLNRLLTEAPNDENKTLITGGRTTYTLIQSAFDDLGDFLKITPMEGFDDDVTKLKKAYEEANVKALYGTLPSLWVGALLGATRALALSDMHNSM